MIEAAVIEVTVIEVTVIYATISEQEPVILTLPKGTLLLEAINASRLTERFPEIAQRPLVMGVFGEIIHDPARFVLADGDRVEIYRPLLFDPKEARRNRVVSGGGKKN